ncbi:MAG: 2-oxoacid:ferredoxin oxidoreductase subunit beta, partial [Candidatus Heimdallarchaeota archaeon]|nr:2-oxoacid:ferredoxin oxidoreductase subunit beta [Candidatus Heimdallarchaeota archaeon]
MTTEEKISLKLHHPLDEFVRLERMPTIWCPGCGIGIALNAFLRSLKRSKMDMDK